MDVALACGRIHLMMRPKPPAHCWCFWLDCCTAPSSGCSGSGDDNTVDEVHSNGAGGPVSVSSTPATYPHHRRAQTWTRQGRHQQTARETIAFSHYFQPNNRKNSQKHQSPTMKKEQRPPRPPTAAPQASTKIPLFCFFLSRMQQQLRWWLRSHELACAGERRPEETSFSL
ncbi:hypothetical protein TcCL_ESM03630 [Trypanosoma cruzi]|nr:hypothetical protein TcCL_ESM03630 [Trypanosoma cruzi]